MDSNFKYGIIPLTDKEFNLISELIYKRFGIKFSEKKKMLIRGRLNMLLHNKGFSCFTDYYNHVIEDPTSGSLLTMIDCLTTNYSYFYREKDHFDFLKEHCLPEIRSHLKIKKSKDLRLWVAGCASGEEAYTLAMIIYDFFGLQNSEYNIKILATDISITALKKAQEGIYNTDNLIYLPEYYKNKYMKNTESNKYLVNNRIKNLIIFKRLNLRNTSFPFKHKFHIIFCRNVMIYFDPESRNQLIDNFYRYMNELSYLFIGHSETLGQQLHLFKYIKAAVYKKC